MNSATTVGTYSQATATAPAIVNQYYTKQRVTTMTPREIGLNLRKVF